MPRLDLVLNVQRAFFSLHASWLACKCCKVSLLADLAAEQLHCKVDVYRCTPSDVVCHGYYISVGFGELTVVCGIPEDDMPHGAHHEGTHGQAGIYPNPSVGPQPYTRAVVKAQSNSMTVAGFNTLPILHC